ncbi:MAG: hypothetical protein WC655_21200 [Candidatus Hydrogenedentales bacterium]|jgi:hypothetical protein
MNKAEQSLESILREVRLNLQEVNEDLRSATPESMRDHISSMDRTLRGVFDSLEECTKFCTLHRPSSPREYDPVDLVKGEVGHFLRAEDSLAPSEPEDFWGDPEQMGLCVGMALRSLAKHGIAFTIRLYLATVEPRIEITPDHAAAFPAEIVLGDRFTISRDEFCHFWTAASDGGDLQVRDDAYVFCLAGDRTRAMIQPIATLARPAVAKAARTLIPWRGAIGQYEEGLVSPEDTLALYVRHVDQALAAIDEALGALN